ncbi:unnamed protein product [Gadus morhua 'NCC']
MGCTVSQSSTSPRPYLMSWGGLRLPSQNPRTPPAENPNPPGIQYNPPPPTVSLQEHRVWGARATSQHYLVVVQGSLNRPTMTRRTGWSLYRRPTRGPRGAGTPAPVPVPAAGGRTRLTPRPFLRLNAARRLQMDARLAARPQIILAAASGPHMAEQTDTERAGGARAATTADKETTLKLIGRARHAVIGRIHGEGWSGGVFDQVTAPAERDAAWERERTALTGQRVRRHNGQESPDAPGNGRTTETEQGDRSHALPGDVRGRVSNTPGTARWFVSPRGGMLG